MIRFKQDITLTVITDYEYVDGESKAVTERRSYQKDQIIVAEVFGSHRDHADLNLLGGMSIPSVPRVVFEKV